MGTKSTHIDASRRNRSANSTAPMVLIVEPSRFFRRVVSSACSKAGLQVQTAREVGGALTAIGKQKPTAVLTALELPGLCGVALVAALKNCPYHKAIPVGALTTKASLDSYHTAYQPDAIIPKEGELADSVLRFLRTLGIGRLTLQETDSNRQTSLSGRILLAEDAAMIHKLIRSMLHVGGAEVMVVENGAQAVSAALNEHFDLILMDLESTGL